MKPQPMTLVDVLRYLIAWLVSGARTKTWGEITIIMQGGQITGVEERRSHRVEVPRARDLAAVKQAAEQVAAIE